LSDDRKTVVLIGDVHAEWERLQRTLGSLARVDPDLVLLTGDIGRDPPWHRAQRRAGRRAHDESVRRVLSQVAAAFDAPVAFVPGNHDLHDPPKDLPALNLDGKLVELAGLSLAGLGGAGPRLFGYAYEWNEAQAASRLNALLDGVERLDIFLSHTPPLGCGLDRTHSDVDAGSRSVDEALRQLRPGLFVCGHIHEAWGWREIDGIPCINAGAMGPPTGQDLAVVVQWDNGPAEFTAYREGRPEPLRKLESD
jgi:Icc-related predicted phosphoesterase